MCETKIAVVPDLDVISVYYEGGRVKAKINNPNRKYRWVSEGKSNLGLPLHPKGSGHHAEPWAIQENWCIWLGFEEVGAQQGDADPIIITSGFYVEPIPVEPPEPVRKCLDVITVPADADGIPSRGNEKIRRDVIEVEEGGGGD